MVTAQYGTWDYVTAYVVLIVAAIVTVASAAVVRQYAKKLRQGHQGRLRLWHTVTVAVSLSGDKLTLAVGQLSILGLWDTPRPVRLIGYAVFGAGLAVSLVLIGLSLWKTDTSAEVNS